MDEIQKFNKYIEKGPYHWRETEPKLGRFNPHLAARYELSLDMITRHCLTPASILDIGCGDGVFTAMLADRYRKGRVEGFDYDATAIVLAREMIASKDLANLTFEEGDAFQRAKDVGLITATDVIEHLHDPGRFLEDSYRTLHHGGCLFLSTPIRCEEVPPDKYHFKEFEFDELRDFSMKFGFSVVDHKSSHDLTYLKRYLRIFRPGIGKLRPFKYLYSLLAIRFGNNVFKKGPCSRPTMQYILLRKPE